MNLRRTNIIIKREYLNKVKKKSFLIITFAAPILFAAMCILPSIIMLKAKEEGKTVAVVDNSGLVMPSLKDSESISFLDYCGADLEELKGQINTEAFDAVLYVSHLDMEKQSVSAQIYSSKPLGMDMTESINSTINECIEQYRIDHSGVENLKEIMNSVKAKIRVTSYTLGQDGKETVSQSEVFMFVSMLLGMVIYMFIAIFGGMVMSSVIEEKSSRVVEVLVSSVKATELLFGKIIAIALVALTQFFLWVALTLVILGASGVAMGQDLLSSTNPTELVQMSGVSAQQMDAIMSTVDQASDVDGLAVIKSTVSAMPWIKILICFVIFFIFGYMLYAAFYAAIGSSGESEADVQQFVLPATVPLLLAFFIALYAFKAPDSSLVFWGSMIPLTSPIVMLARLPFDVPMWELVLSIVLLIGTFIAVAWASAKIYKTGILMFGKKTKWKDLWKWLKQK